jgi:sterol desaturase/sphingolipid hydroxylase (fatty acid hydroxylase superfamily)
VEFGGIGTIAAGVILLLVPTAIGVFVERVFPTSAAPWRGIVFNIIYCFPAAVSRAIAVSIVAGTTVAITNRFGGGLFILPSEGWLFVPAVAAYTIVMDFAEFIFHRAQHAIPALWAMHSFHHSDQAMNTSTMSRHFWAEQAIKTVTIYLLVGLLFQADGPIVALYCVISICRIFFHMNVPVGYGRGWFLLNSPQYHRVHHSSLAEHQDRNFAALLPGFDVIFGTAHRRCPREFPPTGLHDKDGPRDLVEALIWPARGLARRRRLSALSER